MIIQEWQRERFQELAQPLIDFLQENCHPHCFFIIDCEGSELMEGVASAKSLNRRPK